LGVFMLFEGYLNESCLGCGARGVTRLKTIMGRCVNMVTPDGGQKARSRHSRHQGLKGPDLAERGKEKREKPLEYSFIHHRPPHHRR